ncbi:glycine betaine ABC transporter substrate-binding protein [Desulfoglaeba alkanexedens]|nr:glycine betaine ABC transporter substrate-binding protein [Desulfoglaeba alkanexedens]
MKDTSSLRSGLFCFTILALMSLCVAAGPRVSSAKTIRFLDNSWDTIQVHNRIVGFVAKHGYGYDPDYITSETIPGMAGLMRGDADINMEVWIENVQEAYDKGISSGVLLDLGSNFPDSWQGWLVPTYVIQGDVERGIKPMAPDLKSVFDMPKYWELFKDPEDPSKGRFYSSIPGWKVTELNEQKFKAYGMEEPRVLLYEWEGPKTARHMLQANHNDHAFVLTKNRRLWGLVTRETLRQLIDSGKPSIRDALITDIPTCKPEMLVEELFLLASSSPYPIAVVNEQGRFLGEIDNRTILDSMIQERGSLNVE